MRRLRGPLLLLGALTLLPATVYAQATLAGVIRDSSDAVLPGVTVETSSPVLIEKTRTAVTDGTGQYRLTQLPPGTYTLTGSLTGFTTVKREGVEVTGSGVIPINMAMRVGAVAETITVTGETPVVDTQSARRQAVLSNDIIKTLPATRSYGALLTAIPGLQVDNTVNNGAMITPFMTFFTANGGRANEGRMMIDGLNVAASFNGGGVSTFIYDVANTEEMQVSVSGSLGEAENGGPQVNLVPKSGGNMFNGSVFYQGAGTWSSGDNLNPDVDQLRADAAGRVISSWDVNGSGGGPIKKDRLWFFGNLRKYSTLHPVPGAFANLNAGDATKWLYVKNPNMQTRGADSRSIQSFRLTSQLTARNRVSFSQEHQHRCSGSSITPSGDGCRARRDRLGRGREHHVLARDVSRLPRLPLQRDAGHLAVADDEQPAARGRLFPLPVSLGRVRHRAEGRPHEPHSGDRTVDHVRAGELQLSRAVRPAGLRLRGQRRQPDQLAHDGLVRHRRPQHEVRLSGVLPEVAPGPGGQPDADAVPVQRRRAERLRLLHRAALGTERSHRDAVALRAGPVDEGPASRSRAALRYDRAWSWAPAEHNGTTLTSQFNPKPITFPETVSVKGYNDITPRMGVAYDVFGNGKTAMKMNYGKYLQAATNDENYWANNPAGRIVTSVLARGLGGWQPQLRGRLQHEQPRAPEQPGRRRRRLRGRSGATI